MPPAPVNAAAAAAAAAPNPSPAPPTNTTSTVQSETSAAPAAQASAAPLSASTSSSANNNNSSTTPSSSASASSAASTSSGSSSTAPQPQPDEFDSAGDEVKVFNTEGENAEQEAEPDLDEDKTSLIKEDDQKSRDGFGGVGFGAFGIGGCFLPGYAAYANSSLSRSPFFYGDHLSSPPPAHLGPYLDKPGLPRPPIYPPHLSPAYQYMLNPAEQLAAWHQASSMYQAQQAAHAQRLSSMSPFASNALLTHPTLAAAAAAASVSGLSPGGPGGPGAGGAGNGGMAMAMAGQHGHLPHLKGASDFGDASRGNHRDKESPSKGGPGGQHKAANKEPHIKKPLNAFMLYMKEMRPVVQAECTLKESAAINQILGRRWHSLSRDEQAKYYEKARQERQKHLQLYPHWNARDNYRFGVKKKKRKRDRTLDDPASGSKKCRARYGLDQQNLWCKPCRRKKKCIRVQAAAAAAAAAAAQNGAPGYPAGLQPSDGRCGVKGLVHSDGEDDDDDRDSNGAASQSSGGGMDSSAGTGASGHHHPSGGSGATNGHDSLESNSEHSMTSPAGFSSLPSLGSPSGSIASPSTPASSSGHGVMSQSAVFAAGAGPSAAGLDASDWFGRQAFKPPPSMLAASYNEIAARAAAAAAAHHHGHALGLAAHHRPAVGTDPRDSKHPLSVTQLTNGGMGPAPPGAAPAEAKRPLVGMT